MPKEVHQTDGWGSGKLPVPDNSNGSSATAERKRVVGRASWRGNSVVVSSRASTGSNG